MVLLKIRCKKKILLELFVIIHLYFLHNFLTAFCRFLQEFSSILDYRWGLNNKHFSGWNRPKEVVRNESGQNIHYNGSFSLVLCNDLVVSLSSTLTVVSNDLSLLKRIYVTTRQRKCSLNKGVSDVTRKSFSLMTTSFDSESIFAWLSQSMSAWPSRSRRVCNKGML